MEESKRSVTLYYADEN
jgi:hypothetical protein